MMNRALFRYLLSGFVSLGSVGLAIPAFAQCGCSGGVSHESVVYQSSDAAYQIIPESLLDDGQDDPMTVAHITVIVHEKAIVKVNGEETITTGTVRPYIVRNLKPGKTYKFDIRAELTQPKGDFYAADNSDKPLILKGGQSEQVVLKVRRVNRPVAPKPNPAIPTPAVAAAK
ncbi:MAG: hypothetical protein MUC83_11690 [Pirellula sp.]|nr:hypothetical protein [Pirellula sp.]